MHVLEVEKGVAWAVRYVFTNLMIVHLDILCSDVPPELLVYGVTYIIGIVHDFYIRSADFEQKICLVDWNTIRHFIIMLNQFFIECVTHD